jgi:hypothetical protein
MQYALLFVSEREDMAAFENLGQTAREAMYGRIGEWAQKYAKQLGHGEQLQAPGTAKTVRLRQGQKPVITDGPFIEGKEIIGGVWFIDVQDLDEALRIASEWPATTMVEVRPIVERTV